MKPFEPEKLPVKVNWEELIPLIGNANRSLAYYDGILQGIPNPDVLLSPMTTQEAVLSSKIEGTQATFDEVLRYDAGDEPQEESKRYDIHEIINYRHALRNAVSYLSRKPFNLNLLLDLHRMLLNSVRGRDKRPGQFRKDQNWIGLPNTPIEQAFFVPAPPYILDEFLNDWINYYHSDRPDALVQLAIIHAQFEILHPFNDGNGRLGRMLIPIFLYEKKLLSRPMFYLSGYLESNRDEYISQLRPIGVQDGSWNAWIEFFLNAIDRQAKENSEQAKKIIGLYNKLKERVISITHSQYAVPLLDCIFDRPVFTTTQINQNSSMPSKQMVNKMINQLVDAGVVMVIIEGSGQRPRTFMFTELVSICERKVIL